MRMRPITVLLLLVAALVLGSVTTVLVAWRCAVSLAPAVRVGTETLRFPTNDRCGIVVHGLTRAGGIDITVQSGMIMRQGGSRDAEPGAVEARVPAWARDVMVPWGWDGAWQPGQRGMRHLVVRGWPVPAFAGLIEATADTPEGPAGWVVLAGIDRTPPRQSVWSAVVPEVLPTNPVWDGIALDSALFSGGWLIAILAISAGLGAARRARRRRQLRCALCGYAMPGRALDSVCPECGHAEPSQK